MLIIVIIFFVLIISRIKFVNYNDEYISRETTKKINGIFVFLVILRHFSSYIELTGALKETYEVLQKFLGQLIVATFLFYSGYGILEAIKNKKDKFINSLQLRTLKLLIHFDIAVALFAILGVLLEKNYPLSRVLLSFTGWNSIGNSNWYVFAILILYILTFLVFKIFNKKDNKYIIRCVIFLFASIAFVYILKYVKDGKQTWWYNTILCYAAGMFYSLFKNKIEDTLKGHSIRWGISLIILLLIFVFAKRYRSHLSMYELHAIVFALIITLLSMKIIINSKMLTFLGNHIFSIYILQRIPMIIGERIGLADLNIYVYFIFSLVFTIIIACTFDYVTGKLDKFLFGRKKTKLLNCAQNNQ